MFAPDSIADRIGASLGWTLYALVVAASLTAIAAVIAAQLYLLHLLF